MCLKLAGDVGSSFAEDLAISLTVTAFKLDGTSPSDMTQLNRAGHSDVTGYANNVGRGLECQIACDNSSSETGPISITAFG